MNYDIIIIGGGLVGASLACALRSLPMRIGLIDATSLTSQDPRLIALNYASYTLFEKLQIWDKLAPVAATIEQIHVSEQGSFGKTRLSVKNKDQDFLPLGYVVPAKDINTALYAELASASNITLLRPARLKNLQEDLDETTLFIETDQGEEVLTSKVILAADGTHSTVRQLLKIKTTTQNDHQSAIVTKTTLRRSHQHIAYERFHKTGAIAMLPLVGLQCATIWSDQTETIAELMALNDDDFLKILQKKFGYRLGKLCEIGPRYHFPLASILAEQKLIKHTLLIGNAAHTLHPIAAQGLNLALLEIDLIAQKITAQITDSISLNLAELHQQLLAQQKMSVNLSKYLCSLFTSDFFMINLGRQLGMIGLDILPFAKKRFIQRVSGRNIL